MKANWYKIGVQKHGGACIIHTNVYPISIISVIFAPAPLVPLVPLLSKLCCLIYVSLLILLIISIDNRIRVKGYNGGAKGVQNLGNSLKVKVSPENTKSLESKHISGWDIACRPPGGLQAKALPIFSSKLVVITGEQTMDKEINEIIAQSTGEMLICEECGNASWILYLYHALEKVGLQCADCGAYSDINFDGSDDEEEELM